MNPPKEGLIPFDEYQNYYSAEINAKLWHEPGTFSIREGSIVHVAHVGVTFTGLRPMVMHDANNPAILILKIDNQLKFPEVNNIHLEELGRLAISIKNKEIMKLFNVYGSHIPEFSFRSQPYYETMKEMLKRVMTCDHMAGLEALSTAIIFPSEYSDLPNNMFANELFE
jgi:hypothetical protein